MTYCFDSHWIAYGRMPNTNVRIDDRPCVVRVKCPSNFSRPSVSRLARDIDHYLLPHMPRYSCSSDKTRYESKIKPYRFMDNNWQEDEPGFENVVRAYEDEASILDMPPQ